MTTPDFIPDEEFKPDAQSKAISPTIGRGPDFIPDNEFVADEDQFGGVGGSLKAGAAGFARGLTFGLSDLVATKTLGLVHPDTLKALRDENPISTVAGELSGVIAPTLLGGEAGLTNLPGAVSKAGGAVERAVLEELPTATTKAGEILTKMTSKAAGYGTEGAIYGAGQAISENALGDHDLLSEKTLDDIGFGAVLGGGLGALVGGISPKLTKLMDRSSAEDKILAQNIANNLDPASFEGALANSGLPAKDKKAFFEGIAKQKENAKEIIEAGKTINAPVLPAQTSDSKFVQDATSAMANSVTIPGVLTQQEIQKGLTAVDNVIKESLGAAEHLTPYESGALLKEQIQNKVDEMYAPLKDYYARRAAEGEMIHLADEPRIKLYDNLIKQSQEFGSVGSEGGKVIAQYADRALDQNTVHQLDQLISEVGNASRVALRALNTEVSTALSQIKNTLTEFQIKQIATKGRALTKAGVAIGEAEAEKAIQEHKLFQTKYKEFIETLNDLASDQRLGRRKVTHGVVENLLDAIPNEKVIDKLFDPKNADGLARLQKAFPDVFKTLMEQKKAQILHEAMKDGKAEIGKVIRELYNEKRLSSKVRELMFPKENLNKLNAAKTWIESLPKEINPSGTSKAEAMREFLTNPVKASLNNFTSYLTKTMIEKFATHGEAEKLMTLANLEQSAIRNSKKVLSGVKSILGKTSKPIAISTGAKITSAEEYKEKTEQIKKRVNFPDEMIVHLNKSTEGLYAHAPKATQSLQNTLIRGTQFLASKLPPEPPKSVFHEDNEVSKAEIAKFNRYYSIVENPSTALSQIKDGTLTDETIETLNTVYPKLYNDMKTTIIDEIGKMKDQVKIPYQTKQMLSFFLQTPLHPTLEPNSVMANQAAFAQFGQQNAPIKPSKTNMSKVTLAERTGVRQPGGEK